MPSLRPHGRAAARGLAAALSATLVGACASGSKSSSPDIVNVTPQTTRIADASGTGVEARLTNEDRSTSTTVDVTPDQAWTRMAAVYAELNLPVSTLVDASREIASQRTRFRRRLGRTPLTRFVTCGYDISGEDKAASYEVTMDVSSRVTASPENKAVVTTLVTANARPLGVSGDVVRCTTTGNLEKLIASMAASRTP